MKIVDILLILARRCGSNEIIDSVLLLMISKLSVKTHQRPIFMIDGSNERPFTSTRNTTSGRRYSVWVEGIPV